MNQLYRAHELRPCRIPRRDKETIMSKLIKLIRFGGAKRLTKGDIGGPPEIDVGDLGA